MCKNYVAIKIYACGTRGEKETFKFESCGQQNKEGHQVTEVEMGSSKIKDSCGKYTCAVCGPGNVSSLAGLFGNTDRPFRIPHS